ncbi:flagellar filament capping protein FliD [Candidatus Symbiobacter mobilis]|uniref:Flagellar hook-associated protein 2 n=1 Tax=Candidatus Symbiobacter mobilis CR TaxID=946483 RepID=U5N7I0_9BURK|nr:flagellar filament capping protein FliD [Candidatus Symbiobacter mobilis]AGX87481.1 flagellar hook-associated protein 2 [Candidatus Symbiobacter mobilis CR]
MAAISSAGIGSGLDVKSIVSQLVAIEKQPIVKLQAKQASIETKISTFSQIKSLFSNLSSAVGTLSSLTTWNAVTASSSDEESVSASAIGGTAANDFTVQVTGLAKAQSYASASLPTPAGTPLGAGTLKIAPTEGTAIDIEVLATDSVSDIASKINGSGAKVSATVLNDASGERLLLRSKDTGVKNGFTLSVEDTDGVHDDEAGLSRLVHGSSTQAAVDATALINGSITVSSSTNTFSNVISGVTLTAKKVMTTEAEVKVGADKAKITSAVDGFVKAYNEINKTMQDLTKYDAETKQAGLLQGDTTAVSLQRALQGVLQSKTTGSVFSRLADVGITAQLGGDLSVDSATLSTALDQRDEVKKLFTIDNKNAQTNGFALKFKDFTSGLLSTNGFFGSKDASLKRTLEANTKDQTKFNEKVARIEAQLNKRYSALDVQMSNLNALNTYVGQQITQWNKSTS